MLDDDGWPVVAPLMKSWGLELQRPRSVVESYLGSRVNLGGCDQGGPTPVRDVLWASAGPVDPAQAAATRANVCRGWRFPRDPLFSLELCV